MAAHLRDPRTISELVLLLNRCVVFSVMSGVEYVGIPSRGQGRVHRSSFWMPNDSFALFLQISPRDAPYEAKKSGLSVDETQAEFEQFSMHACACIEAILHFKF